jgi:hypothetical protein
VALPNNGQGKQEREGDGKDGTLRVCMAWPASCAMQEWVTKKNAAKGQLG